MSVMTYTMVVVKLCCAGFLVFLMFFSFLGSMKGVRDYYALAVILCCPLLLVIDAGMWYYDGRVGPAAYVLVRACNFAVYFLQYLLLFGVGEGILLLMRAEDGKRRLAIKIPLHAVTAMMVVLICLTPFFDLVYTIDANNVYHRGMFYPVVTVAAALLMIMVFANAIYNNKKLPYINLPILCVCILLVIAADILQALVMDFSVLNIALCMCVAFVALQQSRTRSEMLKQQEIEIAQQATELARQETELERQRLELSQKENELAQQKELVTKAQVTLLRSQMKPHFIFNSLTIIRCLVSEDVGLAIKAIDSFSGFLRQSIRMIDKDELIPFEKEMELVKNYLFLEQQRFPGMVNLVTDFDVVGFMVPALTIQPLVENAVKYGIRAREGQGTVTILTRRERRDVIIQVLDNGVGFDPDAVQAKVEDNGTAIRNIRQRLSLLCRGTLDVESNFTGPETGTYITIRVPAAY